MREKTITCPRCKKNPRDLPKGYCKSCCAEYGRLYREKNRDKFRQYRRKAYRKARFEDQSIPLEETLTQKERARDFLGQYLKQHSCVDCHEDDVVVLEFDHRDPFEKLFNISRMKNGSLEALKEELKKCDVVCANCHRRRTAKQHNSWRLYI